MIGLFASSFVVLLCEWVRYRHQKSDAEGKMYGYSLLLFSLLSTMQVKIENVLNNPQVPLHPTFLQPSIERIVEYINQISIVDYSTFCNNNELQLSFALFLQNGILKLRNYVSIAQSVEIAIIEDRKDILVANLDSLHEFKEGKNNFYVERADTVTSNSPKTKAALENTKKKIESLLESVESLIKNITKECKNNFDWEKDKERIREIVRTVKLNN